MKGRTGSIQNSNYKKRKLIINKYDVKAIHKQFVPHTSEKWLQTHFAGTQRHKSPPLISQRD